MRLITARMTLWLTRLKMYYCLLVLATGYTLLEADIYMKYVYILNCTVVGLSIIVKHKRVYFAAYMVTAITILYEIFSFVNSVRKDMPYPIVRFVMRSLSIALLVYGMSVLKTCYTYSCIASNVNNARERAALVNVNVVEAGILDEEEQ